MILKEFAELIQKDKLTHKVYYLSELTDEEIAIAKENGFVVVFGYSDDCTEFRGVINDEVGCFNGGRVYENNGFYIEAIWDRAEIPWTYETNIPHESFSVWDGDDNSLYCQAIVFDISSVENGKQEEKIYSKTDIEQLKWERDTAIEQLRSYGVGLGEKKELAEVVYGEWIEVASICGVKVLKCSHCKNEHPRLPTLYCCDCGAKMKNN